MSPKSCLLIAIFMLAICLLASSQASAHRVNLFAWVESGQVHVKASFGRKNPARQAAVIVRDGEDKAELMRGQTDESGLFVFAMPESGPVNGLLIRVNAGEGHQNDWQLKAGECAAGVVAADAVNPGNAGKPGQPQARDHNSASRTAADLDSAAGNGAIPANGSAATGSDATLAGIRAIVDASLESKLGPIREAIAQQSEHGPRLQDIVGGLGWIMGIVGISLALRARKGLTVSDSSQ